MTKFQKQMLTIAAAGALTAVTALPAMAFENVFSGSFALKTYLSNYDNAQGSTFNAATNLYYPTQVSPVGRTNVKVNNYTDQRLRLGYTAKASDDLKLVTQFEMNTRWGNRSVNAGGYLTPAADSGTNSSGIGGGIDTDGVNIATRWAYLDFNMGKSVNVKAGQQPYKDRLKGLYVDADLPALQVAYKTGGYKFNFVYSRFNDANPLNYGDMSSDLFGFENTYAFSKDTNVSLVYYLNSDNSTHTDTPNVGISRQKKINTFGVSGETKLGSLALSGFAAMQAGYQKNAGNALTVAGMRTMNYHGWAANVAANMAVGSGKAKTGFLFASGNNATGDRTAHNNAWQTLSDSNNSVGQNSYNESGMMLLARNTSMGGTNTDNYFRKPVSNIALLTMGYDANLTEKVYLNGNVGFAWAPSSVSELHPDTKVGVTTAANNASDFMGTEINLETGYKLYKNLTLKAQAAYVILGGYYKNAGFGSDGVTAKTPDNPFTTRLAATYSF
ncbi:MAG: hypothetical protein OEL57_15385 [Trichlorobacter sp.]|uniref:hypothetical protein n=1 Tax=Trichlorobacter sp. TaxID=2911007 RepID=UPI00255E31CC|nr:hypothetical protein [Trichlorobacter sp.]MDK9719266.1 hypothetical protein [Trichlorobacter sp.]